MEIPAIAMGLLDLLIRQLVFEINLFRSEKFQRVGEHAWNMSVPLKTILFDQSEDFLHFDLVVDVVGEDIFIQRIAC